MSRRVDPETPRREPETPSQVALVALLDERKIAQSDLAPLCGVVQQTISNWATRRARPAQEEAFLLEVATRGRVPRDGWSTPQEIADRNAKIADAAQWASRASL